MAKLKDIAVEILQKCNHNCIYCSSMSTHKSKHKIPFNKIQEIIDFASMHKVEEFSISGGEPFLYKDLMDIVYYANSKEIMPNIYTSGNFPHIDLFGFIKRVESFDLKVKLIFNYNAVNKDKFIDLTNTSLLTYYRVNENIKFAAKNCDITVHIVPNEINIDNIYSTCKYLKEIGVKKVKFLNIVYQGRCLNNLDKVIIKSLGCYGQEDYTFDWEIAAIKKNLVDDNFNIQVNIPWSCHHEEKHYCKAGYAKISIRYDGLVFPCEAFKSIENNDKYILGSIYNNSLEEIYNNGINISREILKGELIARI